jgi:hypothetical protein
MRVRELLATAALLLGMPLQAAEQVRVNGLTVSRRCGAECLRPLSTTLSL